MTAIFGAEDQKVSALGNQGKTGTVQSNLLGLPNVPLPRSSEFTPNDVVASRALEG